MTHIGEGRTVPAEASRTLTVGAPTRGEVLAERYRLEQHLAVDSLGRQVWRGSDVILHRQVAVLLRYPGGESAGEMLSAAVAASRIVHPHLVGVYDAIDEGNRAYVVREWVDGASLRELVAEEPLDSERASILTGAIADAVGAIHATGVAHGNIHPGTVLVASDGRVVLTDARSDEAATVEADLRCIGAVLYCALTSHWPHIEAGPTEVQDAIRDSHGVLASPRQVRGGVPAFLDELTMDLLNPRLEAPAAQDVVSELRRFELEGDVDAGGAHPLFTEEEPALGFDSFDGRIRSAEPRPIGRKIALGIAGLLVIAAGGIFGATRALSSGNNGKAGPTTTASAQAPSGQPVALKLAPEQLRVIDPGGNRSELRGIDKVIDGDLKTGWSTDHYWTNPVFGGYKPGMGIFIDLGSPRSVATVQVQVQPAGATIELRRGDTDPGSSPAGDDAVAKTFTPIGDPKQDSQTTVFLPGSPGDPVRYLMVWISKLPPDGEGKYALSVQEIVVHVQ